MMLRYVKGSSESVSEHFRASEFDCNCQLNSCRGTYINKTLVEKIELVRDWVDAPIFLNSAYRCSEHNKNIGGERMSWHVVGCACDLRKPPHIAFDDFLSIINQVGFDQIIPYKEKDFVHVAHFS